MAGSEDVEAQSGLVGATDAPRRGRTAVLASLVGRAARGLCLAFLAWCAFWILSLAWTVTSISSVTLQGALNNPVVMIRIVDGEPLLDGANTNRTLRLDEMPPDMPFLLIATEDRRFFDHGGIDVIGIARAAVANVTSLGLSEGASTLTMQLAKTSLTGPSPTVARKLIEMALAVRMERTYAKEEILALYLSRIEFGRIRGIPVYGLRDAARVYFSKRPTQLTTAECAILVAMLNGPSYYDPFRNPEGVADRAERVVAFATGKLDDPPSREEIIRSLPQEPAPAPRRDRFLEDHILWEIEALGLDLRDGLYRAITSIDPIAEWQARRVVAAELSEAPSGSNIGQAALVTLDQDGRILAMLGGTDYARSSFNTAILGRRQPGSTAKIATYLAALTAEWTLDSTVMDDQTALSGFVPRNADDRYLGEIPLRQCFRESRNVCTMWLAHQVGFDRIAEMARALGTAGPEDDGSSIVLGAVETSVAENVAAFAAIANGGRVLHPQALLAVLGPQGRVMFNAPPARRSVIDDPAIIEAMRTLLSEVIQHPDGTGRSANYLGGEVFGKTGTTDGNRDAWFVGFTGDGITTGIWVGAPDGEQMASVSGGALPALIFARYNRNMHERLAAYARGEALPR